MNPKRWTFLLTGLLLVFFALLGWRGVALLRDGRPEVVLLGIGVLLLPVVGAWIVVQELRFGRATERLAGELAAAGGLPVDDLPRRRSGRVERAAADEAFAARQAEVEAAPEDWRPWFRLALAYGDAGDTRRGRRAMRQAIKLRNRAE